MQTVEIPLKVFKKIEKVLEKLDQEPQEWVTEFEARHLLGRNGKPLSQGSIYNLRFLGKIPADAYRTGVNGAIFYNKKKLMGL